MFLSQNQIMKNEIIAITNEGLELGILQQCERDNLVIESFYAVDKLSILEKFIDVLCYIHLYFIYLYDSDY